MISFTVFCYLCVCLINLVYDKNNRLLWCLFGVYLILPTPQFFLQDAQLFIVYNYLTQCCLLIITTFVMFKNIISRVILLSLSVMCLVNLFVFLYPQLTQLTPAFILLSNRIYFETLLCLTNFRINKDNKSISLTKNRILQIICFGLIAISYIGV